MINFLDQSHARTSVVNMRWKSLVLVSAITIFVDYQVKKVLKAPPIPKIEETWWGAGKPWREDKAIQPFTINVSNEVLADLKYRLEHAVPFTPPLQGIAHQYGMNTDLLKEIVDHWKTKYDWKKREAYLNKYPQFVTNIQGLDIHYIHVKPKKTTANVKILPLLLLHGWPGSVREFYEIIPILTTPRNGIVFEVIVPSLPGYGFSQAAVRPGLGAAQMARVFINFMKRLGYEKYYIQAGDFGAIISQALSVLAPEAVLGYHSNFCIVNTLKSRLKSVLGLIYQPLYVRPEHADRVYPLWKKFGETLLEMGYLHLQATKPDTLGVALKDSPVGLAAYIIEKFITATRGNEAKERVDGYLKKAFDYDHLLDNIMIYWVTGSMPTAIRLYAETFSSEYRSLGIERIPIQVPTACARFRYDFYSPDGALTEVYPNLVQLTDYDGGHFAAFQLPDVLATDVFNAIQKFEMINKNTK